MVRLVVNLHKLGIKTGILTNRTVEKAAKMRQMLTGIFFDTIMVSSEIGLSKSEAEFFNMFCGELKVKPTNLYFVDDLESNLVVCSQLGINPIRFTNCLNLKRDLITVFPRLGQFY